MANTRGGIACQFYDLKEGDLQKIEEFIKKTRCEIEIIFPGEGKKVKKDPVDNYNKIVSVKIVWNNIQTTNDKEERGDVINFISSFV